MTEVTRRRLGALVAAGAVFGGEARALAAARKRRPAPPVDVIVLGAGVSGLNAAWLLEREGLKVTVLEGRGRVGGRVHTLFDQPGLPELGFNSMGAGYGRGIDAAKRAGLEMYDATPRYIRSGRQELFLGGKHLTRDEWASSPLNPFPADRKTLMPWEISGRIVRENSPLKDWAAWTDPKNAALDVSLKDFLRGHGLSDAAINLAVDTSPYYGVSAADTSALMFEFSDGWAKAQGVAGPQSWVIKGGNERLPQGMAKLLKGEVLLNREVTGISHDRTGATVVCRDGSSFRAKHVICTLPFSTLKRVKIEPGLSGVQAQAVASLPYQPISMMFMTAKTPFWETDRLSPSMWTDGFAGTVLAQRFGATEDEVTGLLVQARGALANTWDKVGATAAAQRAIAEIERLRPAAKGQLKLGAYFSWSAERFNAGDWAYFKPGQVTRLVTAMSAPAGRLHFCGEHTATANRGLEGALESSERAALEILSA